MRMAIGFYSGKYRRIAQINTTTLFTGQNQDELQHTNIYTYRTCCDESERAMHAVMYKRTLWGKQLCER